MQLQHARRALATGLVAVLTSSALTSSALVAPSAQAADVATPSATASARWLTTQLVNGLAPGFGGPDRGLTTDVGMALAAIGTESAALTQLVNALAADYQTWTAPAPEILAGPTAKVAAFAGDAGRDPRTFGPRNLIADLEATVTAAGPAAGRLADVGPNAAYDNTNTFGQAFGVLALDRANSPKAGSATNFLLKQQCAAGYFRISFNAISDAKQSCDEAGSAGDPDATAIAVITLAKHRADASVSAAVAKAQAWLSAQQKADGSFGGGVSTEGANSNSTGLAAYALKGTAAGTRAGNWLISHQLTSADTKAAADAGAIAYDDAALAAARAGGITSNTRDQFLRSTAQAALGLLTTSAQTVVAPVTPVTPVTPVSPVATPAGVQVRLRATVIRRNRPVVVIASRLAPRERVIVRYRGKLVRRGKANKAGVFRARFTSGKGLGQQAVTVIGARSGAAQIQITVTKGARR